MKWQLKVLIQFILSLVPGSEILNRMFKNLNRKLKPDSYEEVISSRIPSLIDSLCKIDDVKKLKGATVLEIGPGETPLSALLFYMLGAETIYAFDHRKQFEYELLKRTLKVLEGNLTIISELSSIEVITLQNRLGQIANSRTLDELLKKASIIYYAPGDAIKNGLERSSIDIVYSNAVLEHLPKQTIIDFTTESKRILKPSGVIYHNIEIHDHYAYDTSITKVNFLKYSEELWSFFTHNKFSYHNRLRAKQFKEIFENLGSIILHFDTRTDPKDVDVVKEMKVDNFFSGMTPEELAIYQVEIIMQFEYGE